MDQARDYRGFSGCSMYPPAYVICLTTEFEFMIMFKCSGSPVMLPNGQASKNLTKAKEDLGGAE
eukprot:1680010-Amphidinium_carterae.1